MSGLRQDSQRRVIVKVDQRLLNSTQLREGGYVGVSLVGLGGSYRYSHRYLRCLRSSLIMLPLVHVII